MTSFAAALFSLKVSSKFFDSFFNTIFGQGAKSSPSLHWYYHFHTLDTFTQRSYWKVVPQWTLHTALGQLRLNPPGLGSKCSKWVERFSDFRKYKGNFRNHTTSLPAYCTLSKWGKWVDRLSDFGKYKGYIRNHSTSLPAYRTLSQVRGGSTSADLAVFLLLMPFKLF